MGYKENPKLEKPEDENVKIWRYMDFTEFVSLLDRSALFFCRADKLGDPFEGSSTKPDVKRMKELEHFDDTKLTAELQELSNELKEVPKLYIEIVKKFLKNSFINCWHLNEFESAAMWKLYLKTNEGIAIQSTFGHLKECFREKYPSIYIGKVKYIDYDKDSILKDGVSRPHILYKRRGFEHERELRAFTVDTLMKGIRKGKLIRYIFGYPDGLYVNVNLDVLIERIYVAPTCPHWFFDLVESVTDKYGLDKEVLRSALDAEPVY